MSSYRSKEWHSLPDTVKASIEKFQSVSKVPLGKIAEELGLIVKLSTLPANISGEIRPVVDAPGEFIIRVNRHEAKVRQRFTLAHEISHFLLHKDQIGDGIEDNVLYRSSLSDVREAEANRLAADLIMPWNILEQKIRNAGSLSEYNIEEIAKEFEVSKVALKIRLGIGE